MDWGECTLIMVKRPLARPRTALAGAMLTIPFVAFRPSMAKSNAPRVRSLPFIRRDLEAIVGLGSSWERVVWWEGCEGTPNTNILERPFVVALPFQAIGRGACGLGISALYDIDACADIVLTSSRAFANKGEGWALQHFHPALNMYTRP